MSSPLRKYPIHTIYVTEPHGYKHHYKVSNNSYTECSHVEGHLNSTKTWMNFSTKKINSLNIQMRERH